MLQVRGLESTESIDEALVQLNCMFGGWFWLGQLVPTSNFGLDSVNDLRNFGFFSFEAWSAGNTNAPQTELSSLLNIWDAATRM